MNDPEIVARRQAFENRQLIASQNATCTTCRYWGPAREVANYSWAGVCRRNSPVANHSSGNGPTDWPKTAVDDWCGDYAPALLPRPICGLPAAVAEAQLELIPIAAQAAPVRRPRAGR